MKQPMTSDLSADVPTQSTWRGWRRWLHAWRNYIGRYRAERRHLAVGCLAFALASAALGAHGTLTWPAVIAIAQVAGALFTADALGRVIAGTVCDYLFERRMARICAPIRLHALATGDLEAAEAQTRSILEVATECGTVLGRSTSQTADGSSGVLHQPREVRW